MCELALPGTQELVSCQFVLASWEDSCTLKLCMWILVPTHCLRTFLVMLLHVLSIMFQNNLLFFMAECQQTV